MPLRASLRTSTETVWHAVVGGTGAQRADSNHGLGELQAPPQQSLHHVLRPETPVDSRMTGVWIDC